MFSTEHESHVVTRVYDISLSDHYMTYTIYSKIAHKTCLHKEINFRNYKRFNIDSFRNALSQNDNICNTSWSADQLADKWNKFKDGFIKISNNCAPMETRRLKHRNNPWINSQIIELIYERDYLKRKAIQYKNEETWLLYKRARNNVTEMIKLSKKQYYENSIQESRHNPTKMWKVLKQLTHGNNRESPPNTLTADIFNSYFTNIGLDTVSHLQPTPTTGVDGGENDLFWRGSNSTCCFDFTTIEQDSVKKHLLKLGDVTNNDVLGFDSRMLFLSADIIAPILTKFYNVSVETETVISDWKLSKVTPIYKGKGSKDEAGNYRPISLISHIMKIFEK